MEGVTFIYHDEPSAQSCCSIKGGRFGRILRRLYGFLRLDRLFGWLRWGRGLRRFDRLLLWFFLCWFWGRILYLYFILICVWSLLAAWPIENLYWVRVRNNVLTFIYIIRCFRLPIIRPEQTDIILYIVLIIVSWSIFSHWRLRKAYCHIFLLVIRWLDS